MSAKRVHTIVSGTVHGVGFRWHVQQNANKLGIKGWVRNRADGNVEFEAQGDTSSLDKLLTQVHKGPRTSNVETIETSELPLKQGETGFEILDTSG